MKKWLPIIIVVAVVFILFRWWMGLNNTMVEMGGNAKKQWANVESAYQRRADLISNLVKTVQGAADFEKSTLKEVMEARAKATSVNIDASNLTEENLAQFQQAQSGLSSSLSRLLVSVENYPNLKANQNFLELQSQIEGTENRINVERNRFNDVAGNYNIYIKKFPNSLVANFSGHKEMPLFKAEAGAEKAPNVEFNFK